MNMMTTLNLRALVTNDNGEPRTTSHAVAQAFGKTFRRSPLHQKYEVLHKVS